MMELLFFGNFKKAFTTTGLLSSIFMNAPAGKTKKIDMHAVEEALPQKHLKDNNYWWRKRKFKASRWPANEQTIHLLGANKELVKDQVAELTEEAKAKLAEQFEVARQAAAIVARAATKLVAKNRAAAKKAAKKAARKAAAKSS